MSSPRDRLVDLVLLGVAVVWGGSYLAAKLLVDVAGVVPVLALRYLVAVAALGIVVRALRARIGVAEWRWGVLLGLSQAAVLALETTGVAGTSATNAGLLIATTILMTPLAECVVVRRWLPPTFFAAALVVVVGVGLLVGSGGVARPSTGDLLVLAAAVVRAAHVTALGRVLARTPLDLRGLTFVQTLVGAVLFTALAPSDVAGAVAAAGPAQWAGIAFLALGASVFAFLAQSWAVARTSAARASLLLGTEPLWAVVVGVAVGGERFGIVVAAGALLVLAGTSWGQRVERLSRAVPTPRPEPLAETADGRSPARTAAP